MNTKLYKAFQDLGIDKSYIGIASKDEEQYFCTPIGANIIGWDSGIHYCFIPGLGEIVFAVNPDTCCVHYVYPIAANFADFLSLILASNGTNALQQIILWDKQQYTNFIISPDEVSYSKDDNVIAILKKIQGLGITSMQCPFEYVTNIQKNFDYKLIPFSDEFYDVTGIKKN